MTTQIADKSDLILSSLEEPIPYAKIPFCNASIQGWVCPNCGAREYPIQPGKQKCVSCGMLYQIEYIR